MFISCLGFIFSTKTKDTPPLLDIQPKLESIFLLKNDKHFYWPGYARQLIWSCFCGYESPLKLLMLDSLCNKQDLWDTKQRLKLLTVIYISIENNRFCNRFWFWIDLFSRSIFPALLDFQLFVGQM